MHGDRSVCCFSQFKKNYQGVKHNKLWQVPGWIGLFVCHLLRVKLLDLHLKGKFVNVLLDKLGKLGKMFFSIENKTVDYSRSKSSFIQTIEISSVISHEFAKY